MPAGGAITNEADTFGALTVISGGSVTSAIILGPGTLDLQSGAIAGGIRFQTNVGLLRIEGMAMPTATISGFVPGDRIDLTSIPYDPNGSAVMTAGDVLQVSEGGQTYSLNFYQAQSYGAFYLAPDRAGGTLITNIPPLRFVAPGDLDGNRSADLLFTSAGQAVAWLNGGNVFAQSTVPNASMGTEWSAYGTGDFNGDGKTDILWTNGSGQAAVWQMNGASLAGFGIPAGRMGSEWHVAGIGDFSGDGRADIFWASNTGDPTIWEMNGPNLIGLSRPAGHMGSEWSVAATGDFTGDGTADLLWVSSGGDEALWTMSGGQLAGFNGALGHMGSEWHVAGAGDVNGDGTADIIWADTSNDVQIWQMSAGQIAQFVFPSGHDGPEWHLKGVGDFTGDGRADLLWLGGAGGAQIWDVNGTQVTVLQPTAPPTVFNF